MGVSDQHYTPAALYHRERTPGTHWTGGWVGPRAGLDAETRRKLLCLSRIEPRSSRHYTDWAIAALLVLRCLFQVRGGKWGHVHGVVKSKADGPGLWIFEFKRKIWQHSNIGAFICLLVWIPQYWISRTSSNWSLKYTLRPISAVTSVFHFTY
jgi:hypothetical protein